MLSLGIHSGHCSLRLGNDWCISFDFSSFSPLALAFITRRKDTRKEVDNSEEGIKRVGNKGWAGRYYNTLKPLYHFPSLPLSFSPYISSQPFLSNFPFLSHTSKKHRRKNLKNKNRRILRVGCSHDLELGDEQEHFFNSNYKKPPGKDGLIIIRSSLHSGRNLLA
jgi:hypothetical protein